jgi:hypothetical protein
MAEIYWAEMFAIAAILPLNLHGCFGRTEEIQFAQDVTATFALDRGLPGSEESFVVLATEYSHFCCSV